MMDGCQWGTKTSDSLCSEPASSATILAILPTIQHIVSVDTTLLLNRIRVLVVRFGDALPFAVDLQEKKDVREVDLVAPALFEDAHDSKRFFEFQHVDARLEVLARAEVSTLR